MRRSYRLDVARLAATVVALSGCAAETEEPEVGVAFGGPPVAGIDLIETLVGDPPAAAINGDSFSGSDTVQNNGDTAAGASTTRYFLSLNGTQKAPGTKLLGSRSVGGVGPSGSDSGTATLTIPAGTPQATYFILACADQTQAVTEVDETNNCAGSSGSVVITAPDLTESTVSAAPAVVDSLGTLSITETLNNVTMTGAGQSTTRFYFSTDAVKSTDDGFVRACVNGQPTPGRTVAPITGGGTDTGTTGVPLCVHDGAGLHAVAAGSYFVIACADELKIVSESDETNNCAVSAATFQVTVCGNGTQEPGEACDDSNTTSGDGCSSTCQVEAPADLIETAVSDPPANTSVGGAFNVTDTVQNTGTVTTIATTTRYYLSTDQLKDGADTALSGTRAVPSLASGASSSGTVTVTVPAVGAGSYFLLACADDDGVVVESSEANNCIASTTKVSLAGADLIMSAVGDPPATALDGASFQITNSVQNIGAISAGVSVTHLYLSLDKVHVGPGTKLMGTRNVGVLGAGNTSAGTTTFTIPADTPQGTYFVLACADHTSLVTESNENNNCSASNGSVIVTAPDLVEQNVIAVPATVPTGAPISITETVANVTMTPAGASFTRFYLSTDNVFTTADPVLRSCTGSGPATERSVPALGIGGTSTGTTNLPMCVKDATLHPAVAGTYFLFACADQHSQVFEASEKNNCTSVSITILP